MRLRQLARITVIGIALLVAALTAPSAIGRSAATPSWTLVSPSTSPPARYSQAMATDRNGNVVLFGGNGATTALGDTWLWNGTTWSQPALAGGPSPRAAAAAAIDRNGKVVLFGGINASTIDFKNDTWLWDGSSWRQASPSTNPPARYGATMATDKNGNVVLFGGQGPGGNLNDTWLWDGANWTLASPTTSPSARLNAGMATDKNGMVVLFGGFGGTNGLDDTWLWDGSTWNQKSLATNPPARTGHAMAADGQGEVVLFGGNFNPFLDDTWLWDGSSWTQASPITGPSGRFGAVMATDKDGRIVLFGGYRGSAGLAADTWLFSLSASTDSTKPTVRISRPVDGAVYPLDKPVSAAFKCADNQSGLASCAGTQSSGANPLVSDVTNLDTSTLGSHTITVTGTDMAGNVWTVMSHYTVVYTWNGFFAPIGNESDFSLNLVHAGDLIKIGFGLNGDRGLGVLSSVTSVPVACPAWAPNLLHGAGVGATAGLAFGVSSDHYTYGWQTSVGWAGTCRQFQLRLNDGTPAHTAVFMFFA